MKLSVLLFFLPALLAFDVHEGYSHWHVEDHRLAWTQQETTWIMSTPQVCAEDQIQMPNPLLDPNTFNAPNASVGVVKAVSGLSFCSMINYEALLPEDTTPQQADAQAEGFYTAAESVLNRFDCRDFYPYMSCDPCRVAYKIWLCATFFPMPCSNQVDGAYEARKVCKDVCYEVVRKCPVELEFHCPTDDKAYADPDVVIDGLYSCNPVNYTLSPASKRIVSVWVTLFSIVGVMYAFVW